MQQVQEPFSRLQGTKSIDNTTLLKQHNNFELQEINITRGVVPKPQLFQ